MRRRTKVEAQRQWVTAFNGKKKLDNYFNRQFTDHISTQNGVKDENEVQAGIANVPRKWMWTVPRLSEESMGIIPMPLSDPMMLTGMPLLCLGEMAEWNRLATVKNFGLIEWRLMGHTMAPVQQAFGAGLDHDCSTWDELYEDEDENVPPRLRLALRSGLQRMHSRDPQLSSPRLRML